jgi:protein involved in polysaccharide export with SLBB domain
MTMRSFILLVVILTASGSAAAAQDPSRPSPAQSESSYVIRAGDVLKIRVWPDSSLGGDYPVEESGFVYLPVLGETRAAGVELNSLRGDLRKRYGEAMRSPAVSVTPVFRVSVLGAVENPGVYEALPNQTLFDVISLAGGFRDNAKTNELRVMRGGSVINIDARAAMESGSTDLALALRSGDRIIVPHRRNSFRLLDVFYVLQSVAVLATLIANN